MGVIKMNVWRLLSPLLLLFLLLTANCGDDEGGTAPPEPTNPNIAINNWIYDVMDEIYYWTSSMPDAEDVNNTLDPLDYFEALEFGGDRFSFIVEDYQDLINLLEGVTLEAGYEFVLFREGANNVIAVVKYVKDMSPAKAGGLERGDVIYAINGQTITLNNYQSLLGAINSDHTVSYSRYSESTQSYIDAGDIELQAVVVQENPNLMDTVYTFNDRKIGYYFYTFFSPGIGNGEEYDQQMDEIFMKFKSEGITDLIIDLRYNSGGSIASTLNLGSLVAPNVTETDIFYENRWNDFYTTYIESLDNGDDILRGKFKIKSQNIGNNLLDQTVIVLVGNQTASASELIINGLSPYMNVEIVGDTTVGKNVGSVQIYEEDDPTNNYGMLPIVLKVFNSQGQSNYDKGFFPVGSDLINENYYRWYPVGDVRDPLISRAIEKITGSLPGSISGRAAIDEINVRHEIRQPSQSQPRPMIFELPDDVSFYKP